MFGKEALDLVLKKFEFQTVLDIGCGVGTHSHIFRENKKTVTTIEINPEFKPDIVGDFASTAVPGQFDLVWCCHVLEHQQNVGFFLKRIFRVLRPGGILAITVPPMKSNVVGGHLTVWNAGLLIYNLILAGFDCSDARVKEYGYNISLVCRKKRAKLPELKMDYGDIELLAQFFPFKAFQGFNGGIHYINWE